MRLISARVRNFGSYDILDFNYAHLGLTLINGSTGSGKSTLMDISCWALFGVTAKGGTVEDVRNWNSLDKKTQVALTLEHKGTIFTVTRTRGKREENDLEWLESDDKGNFFIGKFKDVLETQKFLEERLGLDAKTYCAGSYHSEFSAASSFFTAKASDRRKLIESIVPLEFPILLSSKTTLHKKSVLKKVEGIAKEILRLEAGIQVGQKNLLYVSKSFIDWNTDHDNEVDVCKYYIQNFENIKKDEILKTTNALNHFEYDRQEEVHILKEEIDKWKIKNYEYGPCPTCGSFDPDEQDKLYKLQTLLDKTKTKENPHLRELDSIKNNNTNYQEKLQELQRAHNPFSQSKAVLEKDISIMKENLETYSLNKKIFDEEVSCLEQLEYAYSILRARMIENSIQTIQNICNDYMIRFFDGEFTISIKVETSDKLEVEIYKNGHTCNFQQLSKGQRGLLKLVFSLSIMKEINNKSGHRFNTIFLDEALDGLDPEFKVKAFSLFNELEQDHESVLIIDHSEELRNMFDNVIKVSLVNEYSKLRTL